MPRTPGATSETWTDELAGVVDCQVAVGDIGPAATADRVGSERLATDYVATVEQHRLIRAAVARP